MKKHFLTKPVFWRTNAFLTLYGLSGACLASGFSLSVEQGTGNLGNASAGSAAVAEDATTIFYNPAGLTRLSGTQYHAGGHFVAPSAKFSDGGSVTSLPTTPATPLFGTDGSDGALTGLVPNFYYATDLTESLRFGLGVSVPYGLSTEYSPLWRGRYHALESHLMTLNLNPTLAFKATEQLSVGFGINAQYAKAELSNAIDTGTACAGLEAATLITAGSCSTAGLAPLQSDG